MDNNKFELTGKIFDYSEKEFNSKQGQTYTIARFSLANVANAGRGRDEDGSVFRLNYFNPGGEIADGDEITAVCHIESNTFRQDGRPDKHYNTIKVERVEVINKATTATDDNGDATDF